MENHMKLFTSLISAVFFLAELGGTVKAPRAQTPPTPQPQPGQQQSSQPAALDPANPPWNQTRERVPKEVKDKEKETVATWCPPTSSQLKPDTSEIAYQIVYRDPTTGTLTTVRHKEQKQVQTTADGRVVDTTTVVWEILVEEPNKKTQRIIYRLLDYEFLKTATAEQIAAAREKIGDVETRREKGGGRRVVTKDDFFDPANQPSPTPSPAPQQAPKGSWLQPSTRLANVSRRILDPLYAAIEESTTGSGPFMLAQSTQLRPSAPPQETRQEPQDNIKIVTIGGPPSEPFVVVFEQPPQTTPEQFLQNPPGSTWDPATDPQGPNTATGGPGGSIPVTYIPGGFINIGSGWSSTRIQSSFACVAGRDGGEDDETL